MSASPASQSTDPGSVEAFYVATVERTLAAACRVAGDRDIAQEATQEAYVVMVENWEQWRTRSLGDNQSYIIGIAVKKVADWYRRNGRFVSFSEECDRPVASDNYQQVLDQLTIFKAVRHLLESQPIGMRAVGVLYFIERFEYSEIAHILGVTNSTVRTQVQRLRARLRPLVRQFGEPTDEGEQL